MNFALFETVHFPPSHPRFVCRLSSLPPPHEKTIKRLDDSVRSLVNPPLPPRGPWNFLHPSDALGLTALPVLTKGAHKKRSVPLEFMTCTRQGGWALGAHRDHKQRGSLHQRQGGIERFEVGISSEIAPEWEGRVPPTNCQTANLML